MTFHGVTDDRFSRGLDSVFTTPYRQIIVLHSTLIVYGYQVQEKFEKNGNDYEGYV